jgi:hypothetical protein
LTAHVPDPLIGCHEESIATQETPMDAHEVIVTQLIAQLQTYLEDLRAGQPMNRMVALQLGALLPELRTVVANRLIAIGILREDERDWV